MTMRKLALVRSDEPAKDAGPRLRVAIATQDGKSMNAHFGSARRFVVFEVTPTSSRFLETISFDAVTGESGEHREDAPLGVKVDAIRGCNLLFVLAIGASAASKVINARIHPVKLAEAEPVEQVISKVQELLNSEPPPWLRRALASSTPAKERSMSFLEEEDEP
jgi:nitrogen fixation protein NifX